MSIFSPFIQNPPPPSWSFFIYGQTGKLSFNYDKNRIVPDGHKDFKPISEIQLKPV